MLKAVISLETGKVINEVIEPVQADEKMIANFNDLIESMAKKFVQQHEGGEDK